MRTICCMCRKVKVENGWVQDYPVAHSRLSHGFCPECYQLVIAELREKQAQKRALANPTAGGGKGRPF